MEPQILSSPRLLICLFAFLPGKLRHCHSLSLCWTKVAQLCYDTTGSPTTIHRLIGYWATYISANHCSTNPRCHPLPRPNCHRYPLTFVPTLMQPPLLVTQKKPRVTLINAAMYSHACKLEGSQCFQLQILLPKVVGHSTATNPADLTSVAAAWLAGLVASQPRLQVASNHDIS